MIALRRFTLAVLTIVVLVGVTPRAQAQLLNEQIRVTFSAPVEIPGVVLPAGTYVFMALEPGHITRVLSADEKTVYGTFLTIPEERLEPVEKATITLSEKAEGTPEKVDAWFFPGDSTGSEFMYRESKSHNKLKSSVRGAFAPAEFVGRETGRIVINSGKAVEHAAKYLVS
jgi:hypothetical protein